MIDCGLIKDLELSSQLAHEGFIKVRFFTEAELTALRLFYSQQHEKDLSGFFDGIHMTTWCDDEVHKQEVREGLRKLFREPCERLFNNHRAINHVFILKESGAQTEFNVHQDWSIVDETKYCSLNIWAPLYDVNEKDGALYILPKSHLINQPVRGAGDLFPDYRHLKRDINWNPQQMTLKAGEALIFFLSAIHGSPPNISGNRRIVAVNSIVPQEAPLRIHFQKSPISMLEIYEPSDDFVYEYENLREDSQRIPPKGKLISTGQPYKLRKVY